MQTLIFACYLCLQLTSNLDISESLAHTRDTSCDQCLSGLFTENEILYGFKIQGKSFGETLASRKELRELVEQRLAKYESNADSPKKPKEEPEPEKRAKLDRFLAEEKQKDIDTKNNQRKVAEEIEKDLIQMRRQILEQQANQNREYEEYSKKMRESVKKFEKPTMNDISSSFKHILRSDLRLMAGQSLLSENGKYKATMQESCLLVITDELRDGNIVKKIGSTNQYGSGPQCHMIMQPEGNLVIYSKITYDQGGQVRWQTGTNSGYYVKLENDGELAIYNQAHRRIWTHTEGSVQILRNEVKLMAGQYLLSENDRYKATMQESCFLEITDELRGGKVVKRVGATTYYRSGPECHMIMQDDGNLVIYNKITNGKGTQPTWNTGTNSPSGPGYYAKLGNDGKLSMYDQENRIIWTDTNRGSSPQGSGYEL